jgi:hypothetical protein
MPDPLWFFGKRKSQFQRECEGYGIEKPKTRRVLVYLYQHVHWLGDENFRRIMDMSGLARREALRGIINGRKAEYEAKLRDALHDRDMMLDEVRVPEPRTGDKVLDGIASRIARKAIPMLAEYGIGVLTGGAGPAAGGAWTVATIRHDLIGNQIENEHDKNMPREKASKEALKTTGKNALQGKVFENIVNPVKKPF